MLNEIRYVLERSAQGCRSELERMVDEPDGLDVLAQTSIRVLDRYKRKLALQRELRKHERRLRIIKTLESFCIALVPEYGPASTPVDPCSGSGIQDALSKYNDDMRKLEHLRTRVRLGNIAEYKNRHMYGLKRIAKDYRCSVDDAKALIRDAMSDGFYIKRFDAEVAQEGMIDEMITRYRNDPASLSAIAKDISRKYNMNVSASTISRYARRKGYRRRSGKKA